MAAASGIDPTGLVTFFEGIKKKESFRLPAYLSTHPDLEERIDRLKRLAAESPGRLTKLLPDYNWQDLQGICKKHSLP
jgi:predicted Zn-dependent protease